MKILLGISGSIAAYRSIDFARFLISNGHEVRIAPTASALKLISTAAIEAFMPNSLLAPDPFSDSHRGINHISVARWAETILIYAASANLIARASLGLSDDFLSLQLLAFEGPVLWAPAMNPSMWKHPTTTEHVARLLSRGHRFCGPVHGNAACGEHGIGHIAPDSAILNELSLSNISEKDTSKIVVRETDSTTGSGPEANKQLLFGKTVLISAGPMRTTVDSARFIQNRSSGKTAFYFAREAMSLGARVELILGPVSEEMERKFTDLEIQFPAKCKLFRFISVSTYDSLLRSCFPESDYFLSIAAVLDFEVQPAAKKLTREELSAQKRLTFEVVPVADFVASMAKEKKSHQTIIAFAAESGSEDEILQNARTKLKRKGVNFLLANPLWSGLGPESDENQFWLLDANTTSKHYSFGPLHKAQLAGDIWKQLLSLNEVQK